MRKKWNLTACVHEYVHCWWVLIEWTTTKDKTANCRKHYFVKCQFIFSYFLALTLLLACFFTFFMLKLTFATMQECSSCKLYTVVKNQNKYDFRQYNEREKKTHKSAIQFWFCVQFIYIDFSTTTTKNRLIINGFVLFFLSCLIGSKSWIFISPPASWKSRFEFLKRNTLKTSSSLQKQQWLSNVIYIRWWQL